MSTKAQKAMLRLNERIAQFEVMTKNGEKGYRKPGSLNRKKTLPLGRARKKR